MIQRNACLERGNALDKIGKGTNCAPHPKLRTNQKFSSGRGNLHGRVYFIIIPVCFAEWSSALSSSGLTCQNTGKRADSFTLFWRVRMLRRDSGKHLSFPVTQIRPLTFFNFFQHYLWPHKNPAEIHGSLKCSLDLSCQHIVWFLIAALSLNRKKNTKNEKPKQTNNDFPFLLADCLGNSVNCFKLIQQSCISTGVEYPGDQYPIHPNTLSNHIFNEVSSSASPSERDIFCCLRAFKKKWPFLP